TTIAVQAAPNPSAFGNAVTFTATVSVLAPASGTPTGTVTFREGTTILAAKPLNSAGQATFATSGLVGGAHTITASYSGDTNFTGNASATFNQSITKAGTSTALNSSSSSTVF